MRKLMSVLMLAAVLLAIGAKSQNVCPEPELTFRDNYAGDYTKVVFSWQDPPGCTFFAEGTRNVENTPDVVWEILQPTFHTRSVTFTNRAYRIGPLYKMVIVDMSEPAPFWWVRPVFWR